MSVCVVDDAFKSPSRWPVLRTPSEPVSLISFSRQVLTGTSSSRPFVRDPRTIYGPNQTPGFLPVLNQELEVPENKGSPSVE